MADIPYFFFTSRELGYVPPPGVEAPPKSTCTDGVSLDLAVLADGKGVIAPQMPGIRERGSDGGAYTPVIPRPRGARPSIPTKCRGGSFLSRATISHLPGGRSLGCTDVYRHMDRLPTREPLSFHQMGQTLIGRPWPRPMGKWWGRARCPACS